MLFSFRNLRILLLLGLLLFVALYTHHQAFDSTSWFEPLDVVIFPINADGNADTAAYIQRLKDADFAAIDRFIQQQSKRYEVFIAPPTRTRLGTQIDTPPPAVPAIDASLLERLTWSLQLRYWAWKNTPDEDSNQHRVRIFVLYQQGREGAALAHSLGLQKGLLGVVHAYAIDKQTQKNNLVIAHELLHTAGASDKYGADGMPLFPTGYARPDKQPLHPQSRCEIMAGRLAVSASEAQMPASLRHCVIGPQSAAEIGWVLEE